MSAGDFSEYWSKHSFSGVCDGVTFQWSVANVYSAQSPNVKWNIIQPYHQGDWNSCSRLKNYHDRLSKYLLSFPRKTFKKYIHLMNWECSLAYVRAALWKQDRPPERWRQRGLALLVLLRQLRRNHRRADKTALGAAADLPFAGNEALTQQPALNQTCSTDTQRAITGKTPSPCVLNLPL